MTKICPRCLRLHERLQICPSCRVELADIPQWQKSARGGEGAAPTDEGRKMTPPLTTPAFPENRDPQETAKTGMDMTRFVLGVFLSSLAFFVAFIAAYLASGVA